MTISKDKFKTQNGGVLTVQLFRMDQVIPLMEKEKEVEKLVYKDIVNWYQFKGESTFFVKPEETLDVEIKTDRDSYKPGDDVVLSVDTDSDEDVYVSVVVTDDAVFSKIPYRV